MIFHFSDIRMANILIKHCVAKSIINIYSPKLVEIQIGLRYPECIFAGSIKITYTLTH